MRKKRCMLSSLQHIRVKPFARTLSQASEETLKYSPERKGATLGWA